MATRSLRSRPGPHRAHALGISMLLGALACAKPLTGSECEAFKHKLRVLDFRESGRSADLAKEEGELLSSPSYEKSTTCPRISRAYFDCTMRAETMADLAACKR